MIAFRIWFCCVALLCCCVFGCRGERGNSSWDPDDAQRRGLLVARYEGLQGKEFGEYEGVAAWVEFCDASKEQVQLVVKLHGPHIGQEPRVRIKGFARASYRFLWSDSRGSLYELRAIWGPLPEEFVLFRGEDELCLQKH